jgi:hypothetical protein
MRRRPSTAALVPISAIIILGAGARAADPPGFTSDPSRSLVEQREAARVAAEVAARGDPAEVGPLLADPSAWVRDAALDALVRRADAAALDGLLPLLDARDPRVAGAVAEACALRRHAPAREPLERAALEASEPVALEAVWALEALADPASSAPLERALDRRREPRVRGDALLALAAACPERGLVRARALLGAWRQGDPALRIAALEALLRVAPAEAASRALEVATAVRDPTEPDDARVLFHALSVLRRWAEGPPRAPNGWAEDRPERDLVLLRQAADELIDLLDRLARRRVDGRPRAEVAATLGALTRAGPLGDDPAVWRGWWGPRRIGFVPPDRAAASSVRGAAGAEAGGATRVRFHGLPVVSRRLVFAQDVSGGMRGALDPADPRSPSRLAFSTDELRRVLTALDDEAWVDLAFFATGCRRAAGRLVPAGRARRPLLDFAARAGADPPSTKGEGRSNLQDTIAALLLDDRIDTVYLLSEGGPTEGRFVDPDRVLRHLGRLDLYRQVKVHCLQVTASRPGARFLRGLAEVTGGDFHDLDALLAARR